MHEEKDICVNRMWMMEKRNAFSALRACELSQSAILLCSGNNTEKIHNCDNHFPLLPS